MITDSNQKGTAMTEVACVAALIAIVAVVSLGFMGNSMSQTFMDSGNKLNNNSLADSTGGTAGDGNTPAGGPGK